MDDHKSVIPQYAITKNQRLAEFNLAKTLYVTYSLKPGSGNIFVNWQEAVINLAESLTFDTHHLKEPKLIESFQELTKNPFDMSKIDYYALYKLCHLILRNSGLLDMDSEIVIPSEAWKDD